MSPSLLHRPNYLPTVNRRTVFFSQNQQFDVNPRNASINGTVYKGQVYAGREDLYQFSYTEMHNKVSELVLQGSAAMLAVKRSVGVAPGMNFFFSKKFFWEDTSPFRGATDTPSFGDVCCRFQSQGGFLACTLSCQGWILGIHFGFETECKCHQKSKVGIPVTAWKELCSPKIKIKIVGFVAMKIVTDQSRISQKVIESKYCYLKKAKPCSTETKTWIHCNVSSFPTVCGYKLLELRFNLKRRKFFLHENGSSDF